MNLKNRLARLAVRVDRIRPARGIPDWVSDADLKRMLRSLGSDAVRDYIEAHPEAREALGPVLAEVEEYEATVPRWWGWQFGVRRRGEDGEWRIA